MKVLTDGEWWIVIEQAPVYVRETWEIVAKFKNSDDAYKYAGVE